METAVTIKRILVLCTNNSSRSQMAAAILKSLDEKLIVNSAGKKPIQTLNPNAIKVMKEIGIDISENVSTNVELFLRNDWTYVLTLDENIQENCPIFFGKVRHLIFMGFDDPDSITGTEEEILQGFRTIRNKIKEDITKFYFKNLQ